jgi:hydrogenase-4 component H
MGILEMLFRNAGRGSRTRRPNDTVKIPEGFRGVLKHEVTLCTGCHTCSYVCSPSAITFREEPGDITVWKYAADRCTFCGRCVEFCPTEALRLDPEIPPAARDRSAFLMEDRVLYQPCSGCEKPSLLMPATVLERFYGKPLPAEIEVLQRLCGPCRRKATGEHIKGVLWGKKKKAASP